MKKNRINGFIIVLLCGVMLGACATLTDQHRMEKFSDITRAYGKAVFWSEFEAAYAFRKEAKTGENLPDFQFLKNFKVTSYELKQIYPSGDGMQVRQVVEIDYYRINEVVVKTIRDHQLWEYDSRDGIWYLKSDLPKFE